MAKRGVLVNDPNSTVLVDNVSLGTIVLPREHNKDIILQPKETAQITWAEFVRFKNVPHFGRFIRLNDSIVISDGKVKIKNIVGELSNEELIDLLPQGVNVIKEFALALNAGERFLLKSFLEQRINLGIEVEKCTAVVEFIMNEFPDEYSDDKDLPEEVEAAPKKAKAKRKPRGKTTIRGDKQLIENEDHLSVNVIDVEEDGDSS